MANEQQTTQAPSSGSKEAKLADLQRQIDALVAQREKIKAEPSA